MSHASGHSDRSFESVEFGEELPEIRPDVSLANVRRFCAAADMMFARFTSHDEARASGLPGAIVPGIMSQGILVGLIHRWAPSAELLKIDTIFRSPLLVDSKPSARGVVTDIDENERVIEIDLTIANERGETPVVGTARIRL
jgi:acyl dehydratase